MVSKKKAGKIRELAGKGLSVNRISQELDLPKSTVYYHFRKEVGQKQKENRVKLPENEEASGELCGVFAGDGNFHRKKGGHYRIRFFLNLHDDYWKELADFLEEKLSKRPNIYRYEDKSRATLDYSSKKLYQLFRERLEWGEDKTKTVRPKDLDSESRGFKIGFLRGLLDTDGYRETRFRRYIYGTASIRLRDSFAAILEEFDIDHKTYVEDPQNKDWYSMHKVRISGDDAEKFASKIRPRHPKKQGWS